MFPCSRTLLGPTQPLSTAPEETNSHVKSRLDKSAEDWKNMVQDFSGSAPEFGKCAFTPKFPPAVAHSLLMVMGNTADVVIHIPKTFA